MLKRLTFASILLCLSAVVAHAFWQSRDSNYNISIASSSNNLITPVFSMWQPAATTQTFIGGFIGSGNTGTTTIGISTTLHRVPIPIAGTLSHLVASLNSPTTGGPAPITGGTGTWSATDGINGTPGTVTCNYAATSPYNCSDTVHSDSVAAGDLVYWSFNPGGGTWVAPTGQSQISAVFQASNGQQGFISSMVANGVNAGSSTVYLSIGAAGVVQTTDIAAAGMFTVAGEIDGLYEVPNGPDTGANQHVITVCHNGSTACVASPSSGMFCQNGSNALGCCVNLTGAGNIGGGSGPACGTTTAITIAAGDSISIEISCPGTCSGISPVVSLIWKPSTTNQVPLFATAGNPTNPAFSGVSDSVFSTTNVTYDLIPSAMTFSKYTYCTVNNPAGSNTRTAALMSGASPGTPPASSAGPTVTFGLGAACPGFLAAQMLGGNQDNTNSFSATAGETINSTMTTVGAAAAGVMKIGMAVTVP